ncbi:hypothetical protein ACIOD1_12950 [Streptomyces sp. NPDC088097]|uniref:hypothetical protein n=1 Tax=Streptomyces sp. NPDC088097 TaxID=3365823 RepID=UPI0038271AA3
MRTHHTVITALAAAGTLALTGCSSSDTPADSGPPASWVRESGTSPATAQPSADPGRANLEKTVRAYSAAYFKPDGKTAYATLSKRCQAKAGDAELFAGLVNSAAKTYGRQEIQTLTIDQLAGDLARVSYTYSVPVLNQSQQPWAREGGAWKYDGC